MKGMWCNEILEGITKLKVDILFIIDPDRIISDSKLKKELQHVYRNIIFYKSQIQVRKVCRTITDKTVIVFANKNQIPFDIASKFAIKEINLKTIFPLLDRNVLKEFPTESFQVLYNEYIIRFDKYDDPLTSDKTRKFIERILNDENFFLRARITETKSKIEKQINEFKNIPNDWGNLSKLIGKYNFLINRLNDNASNFKKFQQVAFNNLLLDFIKNDYQDLIYNPYSFLNSKIVDYIWNNEMNVEYNQKKVIICFDGMSFEEWFCIHDYLESRTNLEYLTKYSISLLPTETLYSRLSLFAGLLPVEIKKKDYVTELNLRYEEKLFKEKLTNKGIAEENEVFYYKCKSPKDLVHQSFTDYKAGGIIIRLIDDLVHKSTNKKELTNSLEFLLKEENFFMIINQLIQENYKIFICSDHGNVHAMGNGTRIPKDLVEGKGRRYALYDEEILANEKSYEDSYLIKLEQLIGEKFILLLYGEQMFDGKNKESLTHGGISIQEIFIPFIEVISNNNKRL